MDIIDKDMRVYESNTSDLRNLKELSKEFSKHSGKFGIINDE